MHTSLEPLVARARPWVVATAGLQSRMTAAPPGLRVTPDEMFDPTLRGSADWLGALERLDHLAYERHELTMPRWAFYDCAELPGLVCGLSLPAEDLPANVVDAVGASPQVPVSMAMAVPTVTRGHWLVHTLCSVGEVLEGAVPSGVRLVTLALGLSVIDARRVTATAQWSSTKLAVYGRFGPLEVLSAYNPAHSMPATCTFGFDVDPDRIIGALDADAAALVRASATAADRWLDPTDDDELVELQRAIENGARAFVVGPPADRPEGTRIPLRTEAS